jgi:hypothetical protein
MDLVVSFGHLLARVVRLDRLGCLFGHLLARVVRLDRLGCLFGHLLARVVRFDWFRAPLRPLPCGCGPIFKCRPAANP